MRLRALPGLLFGAPLGFLLAVTAAGCGGPVDSAFENRTFYHFGASGDQWGAFEDPYPPLDLEPSDIKGYRGVKILQGTVRISRRVDWYVRSASNAPEARFIEYVSPRQLIITVSERVESPEEPWRKITEHFIEETDEQGALIVGQPVPRVLGNAQARAFDLERKVAATKRPFRVYSREYLARGLKRVVLVQIVHQTDSLEPHNDELLRVVRTLEVL